MVKPSEPVIGPRILTGISDEPLDLAAITAALEDASSGGVALFIGRVRDHDSSQDVTGLTYEAHPTALTELNTVAVEIAQRYDVTALAAVHRIGDLAIGDIAVIVGTASAHRADTFAATRDLIDTLKARVPIWKHQRFADGSSQWVGLP